MNQKPCLANSLHDEILAVTNKTKIILLEF